MIEVAVDVVDVVDDVTVSPECESVLLDVYLSLQAMAAWIPFIERVAFAGEATRSQLSGSTHWSLFMNSKSQFLSGSRQKTAVQKTSNQKMNILPVANSNSVCLGIGGKEDTTNIYVYLFSSKNGFLTSILEPCPNERLEHSLSFLPCYKLAT